MGCSLRVRRRSEPADPFHFLPLVRASQEASKSVVDDHAPVAKQRAKAFDPEAELARIKQQIDLQKPYEQVKIERPNYD